MTDDPSFWLDHFNGDSRMAALVVGGLTRHRCAWCERELRPCNMARHVAARHHRQMTIYDVLPAPVPDDLGRALDLMGVARDQVTEWALGEHGYTVRLSPRAERVEVRIVSVAQ
jgi:hypothetical protein